MTQYLEGFGVKVRYMHHDIDTIERMEIIRDLRLGEFDVLVGINLCVKGLIYLKYHLLQFLMLIKKDFKKRNITCANYWQSGKK